MSQARFEENLEILEGFVEFLEKHPCIMLLFLPGKTPFRRPSPFGNGEGYHLVHDKEMAHTDDIGNFISYHYRGQVYPVTSS